MAGRGEGRRASPPTASSWRRASSTCMPTCASPATRTPRRSRPVSRRRPMAASRPSARCRTRRRRSTSPGVLAAIRAAAAASGSPVELLAYGAVTAGRAGETLAALGELADAGVVGLLRRRRAGALRRHPSARADLCRRPRTADRRPSRGRHPDRGRRGQRRSRRDRARAAWLARVGRGDGRGARPGDPRRRASGRPGRPTPPHPRLDRGCPGARPACQGGRVCRSPAT